MVLLAPLIQYGATLISALTVLLTVSVAAPGGLLAMREFTRTLDYSARANMAMLSAGNVDRYKRMLKQSVDSALMYHGYGTPSFLRECTLTVHSLPARRRPLAARA